MNSLPTPSRILVGQVYAVPLGDNQWGYIEYAKKRVAFLSTAIWLYDWVSEGIAPLDELDANRRPFTLMLSHFQYAVKQGRWKYVGRHRPKGFEDPQFIAASGDLTRGVASWWVCNEHGNVMLGRSADDVVEKYRNLEAHVSFNAGERRTEAEWRRLAWCVFWTSTFDYSISVTGFARAVD